MGIEVPKIEIRFKNLSIVGEVYSRTRTVPNLVNASLNAIEVLCSVFPYSSLVSNVWLMLLGEVICIYLVPCIVKNSFSFFT